MVLGALCQEWEENQTYISYYVSQHIIRPNRELNEAFYNLTSVMPFLSH